jgi:hypothetical protein
MDDISTSTPSRVRPDPVNFMVIGDWGVGPAYTAPDTKNFQQIHTDAGLTTVQFGHLLSRTENAVIDKFQTVAGAFHPQFILSVGDQFYDDGLYNKQDPQFKNKYTNRFNSYSVNVPWYPTLGNHDYYFSPDAQLQRTDDWRWRFPARYYSFTKQTRDTTVLFVVLDVNPALVKYRLEKELNPNTGKYATKNIVQNLQAMKATWPAQLAWLEQTLAASTAPWKVVIGHEPIYSATGSNSFTELQRDVQPLLEKYRVQMYFAGHYHTLEVNRNNGVDYIISGAASQIPYPIGDGTAQALIDYFAKTTIPSPDPTQTPTLAPSVAPPGTTAYPPETAPPQGVPAQQNFFVGGNEKSLPGFITCSVNATYLHTTVYGMGKDGTWSVVAVRNTPKQ